MSLDAMDWVWTKSKSKGVGRLILLALADKTLTTAGECRAYGSQRWLAGQANCNQETVTEALPVLYALGELELLPEKGPYGAAVYRLPKAIGHERPTRANRSAHPVDSEQQGPKKSTGSPGHPATGSPGRFEPGSTGSPDHNTTTPPKTTTSEPSDPPATPPAKGGGGGSQHQEAETFLAELPAPWTAGRRTARQLAQLLLEVTAEQGWRLDQELVTKLTANPGGVGNYNSVLRARIEDLPKRPTHKTRDSPRPAVRPLPPWCEDIDCDEETRLRHGTVNGFPYSGPCHCHPDHQEDTAA